jgi:Protein of unknown function (DUF742)
VSGVPAHEASEPGEIDAVRLPDPRMIRREVRVSAPVDVPEPEPEPDAEPGPAVRPFIVTGGRTTPLGTGLRIETQVLATAGADRTSVDFEAGRIVELCTGTSQSIAEISAALHLPFGVTRVLVADLVAGGIVETQDPASTVSRGDVERILERVHAL